MDLEKNKHAYLYAAITFLVISIYVGLNIGSLVPDKYLQDDDFLTDKFAGNIEVGLKEIKYKPSNTTEQGITVTYNCKQNFIDANHSFNLTDTICTEAKNSVIPTYFFVALVFILGSIKTYYISQGGKNFYVDLFLSLSLLSIIIMNIIVTYYFTQVSDKIPFADLGAGSSLGTTIASIVIGSILFLVLIINMGLHWREYKKTIFSEQQRVDDYNTIY